MHVGPRSNTPADGGMFSYINNDDLADIIKSDKVPRKDYLIVDVRDDDFRGGNIVGAHNEPSETFLAKVDQLVDDTKDVKTVVFHCMLSQQRGPKAARIYAETRDKLQAEGKDSEHEVLVLRGGFGDFQAKFKNDQKLVENYDPKAWEAGYF